MKSRTLRHRALAIVLSGFIASASTAACSDPTCDEKATCTAGADDGASPTQDASAFIADAAHESATTANDAGGGLDSPDHVTTPCGSPEDCTNGVDDDCNGLTDCADSACHPDHECIAAAPDGWSGPGAFVETSGTAPPSCPPTFVNPAFDGTADPSAAPASCGCTCGAPSKVACAIDATFYFDSSCANACSSSAITAGACAATCSGAQTMKVTASPGLGGSCGASPSKTVPPLGWNHAARVCSSRSGTGCNAGSVCASARPAPFASGACVWRIGAIDCVAPYTTRHVYYSGATDTRDCGACTCGSPHDTTCGTVTVSLYGDNQCSGGAAGTAPSDGSCVPAPSGAHGATSSNATTTGGSCTPTSAGPIGSVTPTGATTVCCLP